ncbi:MAG: hypothetical protein WKG00_11675 [Polyangiaceae bacterium]
MGSDDSPDPFMDEVLDRAVAPYVSLVPPDVLELMRDALREDLLANPTSAKLINRLRPRPELAQSDDVEVPFTQTPGMKPGSEGSGGR